MNYKFLLAAVATVSCVAQAHAALTVYSGQDTFSTAVIGPNPNSAAAAAAFDAAVSGLGSGSLVNFESAPLGNINNLTIAPGVTLSGTNIFAANHTIRNTSNFPSYPTVDGFNTTVGGANFVEVFGGTLRFSFATPIRAFGAYFSGIQTNFYPDNITFSDGTSQTLFVPGAGTNGFTGALSFLGFTDPGKSISSITLVASNAFGADAIGVDDVRFLGVPAGIPEPASWALMLGGFGLVGAAMRRRAKVRVTYA